MRNRSQGEIKAVASDMSPAYIQAVFTNLPGTTLGFDQFHIIKLLKDKPSKLRRQLCHAAKDLMQKEVFKGSCWLLLKNSQNLYPETYSHCIDLSARTGVDGLKVSEGVVVDFDAEGNITGIDIDNASHKLELDELIMHNLTTKRHIMAT
jgi:uncharacterized protein YuzE